MLVHVYSSPCPDSQQGRTDIAPTVNAVWLTLQHNGPTINQATSSLAGNLAATVFDTHDTTSYNAQRPYVAHVYCMASLPVHWQNTLFY